MPFHIVKKGDKWNVENADTGEVKNKEPYDSEEEAQKYSNALNAHSEGKGLDLSYAKSLGIVLPELAAKFTAHNEIKHYAFLWGNSDQIDIDREFFTENSDFWDRAIGKNARPLTWDHAQDAQFNELEPDPIIGKTVDWGNDQYGRWAISVLDTNKQYRRYVDEFIEQKALGYSSDSAPQYIQREHQGKGTWLKTWPWFGGALTPAPCEPRMKEFAPEILKSFNLSLPDTLVKQAWEWQKARLQLSKIKANL